ncbi:DUF6054 family protein [Ruminococcaceae bacterium OttesenSCG-928-O06]|nr:DUF6054 family protein [Ruminococcaceae bacterium OttesenSCG-928-O06]
MAKYECRINGHFDEVWQMCTEAIGRSSTASREDGSDYMLGGVRVAVHVFERYSVFGGNRVSLTLALVGEGNNLFLTAITAGGSKATFFKINTVGEEAFLKTLVVAIEERYPLQPGMP